MWSIVTAERTVVGKELHARGPATEKALSIQMYDAYRKEQSVIFKDERIGGRARVIADEEKVLRRGSGEIKLYTDRQAEWYSEGCR